MIIYILVLDEIIQAPIKSPTLSMEWILILSLGGSILLIIFLIGGVLQSRKRKETCGVWFPFGSPQNEANNGKPTYNSKLTGR